MSFIEFHNVCLFGSCWCFPDYSCQAYTDPRINNHRPLLSTSLVYGREGARTRESEKGEKGKREREKERERMKE